MSILWTFPTAGNVGLQGLNNPGNEHFKDDIINSLAKEICQNSLDARNEKISEGEPVVVEFKEFYLERKNFPGIEQLEDVFQRQIEFWDKTRNDKSAKNFFEIGKKVLDNEKIKCLRISDFNTIGLTDSDDEYFGTWASLVTNIGFCDKPETAGGSFGIGKFASFACSKLNTVFYNTRAIDDKLAYQGVSRLASFKDVNGDIAIGTGYYGEENCKNVKQTLNLDHDFIRNDYGTDIYIMGFEPYYEEWIKKIIANIIDNFMISIYDGKLVFRINEFEVKKENLNYYIEFCKDYLLDYTNDYIEVLLNENFEKHKFKMKMIEDDDVELTLVVAPDMKNRVAMVRNPGMKIYNQQNLPKIAMYSGILILKGNKVNKYFRKLENPQHNGWSPDRLTSESEIKVAQLNKKVLFDFIKESIKSIVESSQPECIDAEGMGEYLPDEMEMGSEKNLTENIVDDVPEKLEIKKNKNTPKKSKIQSNSNGIDEENSYESDDGDTTATKPYSKIKNSSNDGKGQDILTKFGEGNLKSPVNRSTKMLKTRVIFDKNKSEYILMFSSEENCNDAVAKIEVAGEQSNEKDEILSAYRQKKLGRTRLEVYENNIRIGKINRNEVIKINFKIQSGQVSPMEVFLNEYTSK